MNGLEMLEQIFQVCIIPLLGVLTAYAVSYIKAKRDDLVEMSKNDILDKYINMASETIMACVIATNQTYVDALKAEGKFDAEAQEIAFRKTASAVLLILSDDAKKYLSEAFGDLEAYINTQIEAAVKSQKKITPV